MDWSRQDGKTEAPPLCGASSLNSIKSQRPGQARHSGLS